MPRPAMKLSELKVKLPPFITVDETTYVNGRTKARFVDVAFGEFWALPKDVTHGHGHRGRASQKISAAKTAKPDAIVDKLPPHLTLDVVTYQAKTKPARFIDAKYGEFWALPKAVLLDRTAHRQRLLAEGRANRITYAEVVTRLPDHIKLIESTYTTVCGKARFIDVVHGEWETTANAVFNGHGHPARGVVNRRTTCRTRYGCDAASQSPEIFKKAQRSSRKTTVIRHWLSGVELLCVASYEAAVVNYLNTNKIDFEWQIPFTLSDGKRYYCDLYLKAKDTYVEIKGWWRQETSRRKWEEFHATHPNSELWSRTELKSMGIIKR